MVNRIHTVLTPDLLNPKWRKLATGHPLSGHCYVGAEAAYHLLGGKKAGCRSYLLNHRVWSKGLNPGETHWFVRMRQGNVVDPTKGQFNEEIPYDKGIACGFLTKQPSKRAQIVIDRLNVS